jgi:hypothetical protein
MNCRYGMEGWVLTVAMLCAGTAVADPAPCFDEIEQHYEWDDGGYHWNALPDRCPGSPQPASPADRKWGGSVQIRASGQDAMVIEENYSWAVRRDFQGPGCPRFFRTLTRKTRIAKDGLLYETKQIDDEPPRTSQRPMRTNEVIYISNIQTIPKPDDPFVQVSGSDTIAGQPCQRIASKQSVRSAGSYAMCVFVAPLNCPRARYLQPLELKLAGADGQLMWHGRTTLLRYGGHGELVSPDSIKAP